MSFLATRAITSLLHSSSFDLDGRQVISKDKVTTTLVELLTIPGEKPVKQVKQRVRDAWSQVLQGYQPPDNPMHAAFVGVYYACQVTKLLGIQLSLHTATGMPEVMELGDTDGEQQTALVPVEPLDPVGENVSACASAKPAPGLGTNEESIEIVIDDEEVEKCSQTDVLIPAAANATASQSGKKTRFDCGAMALDMVSRQRASNEERTRLQTLEKTVLVTHVVSARDEHELFQMKKLGRQKEGRAGRWSLQSRFSMGLRCCLSTISACDFGLISMIDVSRQTVLRAECITGAGIIWLMRSFCMEALGLALEAGAHEGEFSLFGVGYRSDAINSNIWHRKKLHVVEATAMFLSHPDKLKSGDFGAAMSSRSCVCLRHDRQISPTVTVAKVCSYRFSSCADKEMRD